MRLTAWSVLAAGCQASLFDKRSRAGKVRVRLSRPIEANAETFKLIHALALALALATRWGG